MGILKKTGKFTVVGVSVCGGVFHNVGQLAVAMAVVQAYEVGYYFPVPVSYTHLDVYKRQG